MKRRHDSRMESDDLHPTDADLICRARSGDDTAYHEIVNIHAHYLYRLAFSLVGNAADAEDVLQETFSGLLRSLKKFEQRSTLKTWLTRLVVNQSAKCHRYRGRHKMASLDELSENGGALSGRTAASSQPALDSVSASDLRLDVMAKLDALAPDYRRVVVLREMQGLSYDEIAEVLGVPIGTVESRLFRARQELKELLKDYKV